MMKRKIEIFKAFNRAAKFYDQVAKVQKEIGERLFGRLHYLKLNPKFILDLGCGPGYFSQKLRNKYPKAQIVGLDLSVSMLAEAKKKQSFWQKWHLVNADLSISPFPAQSFDLIFANQILHWSQPLASTLNELNRILKPGGCLMFSTLGPDTFKEIRLAWENIDNYSHINSFVDMHEIGDALLKEHYLDPVMDMEMLAIHYADLEKLLWSLKAQGVRNISSKRNTGLTGKQKFLAFKLAYQEFKTATGKFPLSYEVIYGQAWKGDQHRDGECLETFIPLAKIKNKTV